jgi:hypothetical protein
MDRGEDNEEMLTNIHIDGLLEIRPPRGGEILFEKVRNVIYRLKDLGLDIQWVTFDSWQSVDSLQILQSKGFGTAMRKLDSDPIFYTITKQALYDQRVHAPAHGKCIKELVELEIDMKKSQGKGKVDHRANGSKDVSDGLCGVVSGLTRRREIWGQWNVPLSMIPASVMRSKS